METEEPSGRACPVGPSTANTVMFPLLPNYCSFPRSLRSSPEELVSLFSFLHPRKTGLAQVQRMEGVAVVGACQGSERRWFLRNASLLLLGKPWGGITITVSQHRTFFFFFLLKEYKALSKTTKSNHALLPDPR
jgi:hypothetical protein